MEKYFGITMNIELGKWWILFGFKNGWHICPFNFLDRTEDRYLGYLDIYYDGHHPSFGFWFFNVTWGY